ncbi:FtsX-like permease family protein [Ruminococcus sp.]
MKMNLYPKLAWHGISKNKKTYVPFLLTSIGLVMMFYIVSYLTYNKSVKQMRGGDDMQMILSWGVPVVAFFVVIFLFYMNSFLMRRRKTEFGLYNILGMGKSNIARILLWQNFMLLVVSAAGGLGMGILLSKLAELCAAKMLSNQASLAFVIEPSAVRNTLFLTVLSFVLILLYSLGQIHVAKPIELLHGEKTGEKPPKARWILALIGMVLLGTAYYLAVTTREPVQALLVLFVAIVLVIVGSYLLFICGSVALCKMLQKNKKYYYKLNHFISVSSMSYRMKRNGASLASICILSTGVLVMISSSLCLRIGEDESLHARYPRDIEVSILTKDYDQSIAAASYIEQQMDAVLQASHQTRKNELAYSNLNFAALRQGGDISVKQYTEVSGTQYAELVMLNFVTLDTYEKITGTTETLGENEVLLHMFRGKYSDDSLNIDGQFQFHVQKQVDAYIESGDNTAATYPTMYLVVPDGDTMNRLYEYQYSVYGEKAASSLQTCMGFDLDCNADTQIELTKQLYDQFAEGSETHPNFYYEIKGLETERYSFYSLFGGLLFLGILLSVVFLFGTVLIMYYKQISEGYEDAARFEILQKVGMTRKEIKKSINSQILTVFAAPLLASGVHLCFAFPLIQKLLLMFGLSNTPLLVGVTVGSYLIFGVLYAVMYKATSRSYYQLVK